MVDESLPRHPIQNPGELIARARANAVKARQAGRTGSYRCPACWDQGWILEPGVSLSGKQGEVARRCDGPTKTGCLFVRWQTNRTEQPRRAG